MLKSDGLFVGLDNSDSSYFSEGYKLGIFFFSIRSWITLSFLLNRITSSGALNSLITTCDIALVMMTLN